MSEKNRVILKYFEHWVAPGRGTRAEGNMHLILENQGNDIWKAIDYSNGSFSATGHSCGMFSDEKKYFDSNFDEIKELSFTADKKALEYLADNHIKAQKFFDVMKQTNYPMHIGTVGEHPALLFNEHKAISPDSPNMQLYKKEYDCIIPAEGTYRSDNIFGSIYINEMKNIDEITFPKIKNNKMIWLDTQEFPKNLYGIPLDRISIGEKNNLVISSDFNTKHLIIRNASNIQILEGDFETIEFNGIHKAVISPKVKTKKVTISNSSHIALPTSLGNVSDIKFGWCDNSSDIYIYDKTPKDKVLFTLQEEKHIAEKKDILDSLTKFYDNTVKNKLHNIINSSNVDIKDSQNLKRFISERNKLKEAEEALHSDSKIQEILENNRNNIEEQENMSLKDLYKKLQKKSGIANAELLTTKKIIENAYNR